MTGRTSRKVGFRAPRELPTNWRSILDGFRELGLRRWKRNLMTSFTKWLRKKHSLWGKYQEEPLDYVYYQSTPPIYKLWSYKWSTNGKRKWKDKRKCLSGDVLKDVIAGRACIWRGAGKDIINRSNVNLWWEWELGSRCHFWRWPQEFIEAIRDGQEPWWTGREPHYRVPHRPPKDPQQAKREKEKVNQVRQRGYIDPGFTSSLMPYFSVVKVKDSDGTVREIWMIYHESKSGLNGALFSPHISVN